jgi:hypothetical protein
MEEIVLKTGNQICLKSMYEWPAENPRQVGKIGVSSIFSWGGDGKMFINVRLNR